MKHNTRVVVALDPSRRDLPALDMVRCMIREASPELIALLIEDIRRLEHAHSRLAPEVMHFGVQRPLDVAAPSRPLRAQSARVRRRFKSAASELGLACTFQVARGEVFDELASKAAETEALIVSFTTQSADLWTEWVAAIRQLSSVPLRGLLFAREGWTTSTRILGVIDHSANSESVLGVAVHWLNQAAHRSLCRVSWHGRADDVNLVTRLLNDIRSAVLLVR